MHVNSEADNRDNDTYAPAPIEEAQTALMF
jgi:hypothetical protein